MKSGIKRLLKFSPKSFKRMSVFSILSISVFCLLILFLGLYLFRFKKAIDIEVKVLRGNPEYSQESLPFWLAYSVREGDVEKDILGREEVRILSVRSYEYEKNQREMFLKVRLLAVFNKRLNQFEFRGKPVLVGSGILIRPGNTYVQGLVTKVVGDNLPKYKIKIEAVVPKLNFPLMDVFGTSPWEIEAIHVGDINKDSFGDILVTIVNKKEVPGLRISKTDSGDVLVKNDPYLKRAELTIELAATKVGDTYYYLADQKIKIGKDLAIDFPHYSLLFTVTKIIETQ